MGCNNVIYGINGPVVTVRNARDFSMQEMVFVGNSRLAGEVIGITDRMTTIQVYEQTTGLRPGEPVETTGHPMSVMLGPGIISNIYDGIQRSLEQIQKRAGNFIERGLNIPALDETRLWDVHFIVKEGDALSAGDVYATCPETPLVLHKCLVPPTLSGTAVRVAPDGQYHVNDAVLTLRDALGTLHELTLCHLWPIRKPRPFKTHRTLDRPLMTGQRNMDTLFPIAKGGTAAIPGGFGAGKTVVQHQLAKWCDADIIIYIGCGERGNEMTQVLEEFKDLVDPKSHRPLMDRTVLIANTSNMPVAAREASIYTGVTLAEYYRDMGYSVAVMADSTSRWAEALREISGRLEEMPAEEGFPAYLPSRLAEFYERAGRVENLNGTEGSVSIIGAVSPEGGDLSEPVTQNTRRFIRCFWALDKTLAYVRHYPAINWLTSYSEYLADLKPWYDEHVSPEFMKLRGRIVLLLKQENQLMEIVKLIGSETLPDSQKLVLETCHIIRVGFLQQDALDPSDTYVTLEKQLKMMEIICLFNDKAKEVVAAHIPIAMIAKTGLIDRLLKLKKNIPNDRMDLFDVYRDDIESTLANLIAEHADGSGGSVADEETEARTGT